MSQQQQPRAPQAAQAVDPQAEKIRKDFNAFYDRQRGKYPSRKIFMTVDIEPLPSQATHFERGQTHPNTVAVNGTK